MPSDPLRPEPSAVPRARLLPFAVSTPLVVFLTVVLLWIGLGIAQPRFLGWGNVQNIMVQMAIQGVIGVGAVLIILTGGIDLSVGSLVGFVNILFALLLTKETGLPIPLALAIGLAVSALVGLANGVLVHDVRLPPFIATLGMMTILRGATLLMSGGRNVSDLPRDVSRYANSYLLTIPSLFWVLILVVVLSELLLRRTAFGRYVYALGSNREAARLTGVNTRLVTYGVYVLGALLGGLAGVMETGRLWMGVPSTGAMYELDAIAAAVLGGASLGGAEGTAVGAFIGALLMATIYNGAVILGIDSNITKVLVGVILIITVGVDQIRKRRSGG